MSDEVMITAPLRARDLPRWSANESDPDLRGVDPDWPVTISVIETETASDRFIHGSTMMLVDTYETAYRRYGAWALPPAVGIAWDDEPGKSPLMISGNHRRLAARRAGVEHIPYLVIHVPADTSW